MEDDLLDARVGVGPSDFASSLPIELEVEIQSFLTRPQALPERQLVRIAVVMWQQIAGESPGSLGDRDAHSLLETLAMLSERKDLSAKAELEWLDGACAILASHCAFVADSDAVVVGVSAEFGSGSERLLRWAWNGLRVSEDVLSDVGTLGAYKEKAARVLGMLEKLLPLLIRTNIGIAPDSAAPHPAHADLFLWAAASQLGESVWATTASRATAQAIVGKLLHVSKCPSLSELVKTLASALFGSKMRPFFRHSFAVDKRATALPGPEDLDQQPWKTERCDALAVLKWCLFRVEGQGAFDSILTHVLPPLLVVLDDFEPSNKLEGVRLLSHVLQHLSDGLLKRTGLGDVMLDALMTALTFQDQAALVQSAVETILRLVPRLETTATKEYHERLERVLADGLISGLTYAKSDSRETVKCLLEASGALCEMHGVLTVRYFKSLLDIYCEVIRKPYVALELRISACKALRSAMEACHPAVTRHRGAILSAVAEAWMESHRAGGESMQVNGEVSTLVDELRQVVVDLKGTCGQSIDVCPIRSTLQRLTDVLREPSPTSRCCRE